MKNLIIMTESSSTAKIYASASTLFSPIFKIVGPIGTVAGFIADVLSPLGPFLKYLLFISFIITISSTVIYFLSKNEVKLNLRKVIVTSLFFTVIFGVFFQMNKETENGFFGDNIEVINSLQGSLNLLDKKLNDISNDIQQVGKDIKDVKEIITGDAELKNMSSTEDLNVTKELNNRTENVDAQRIAILYFSNSGEDDKLNMLKKGLADMLISDLSNINMLNIVERDQIEKIITEQRLNNSSEFDPETASKIGKLLGAEIILTGAYFEMFETIRLDARFIDVATGKILKSDGVDGESSNFFKIQKQLSWKIIKNLDTKISEEEINTLESEENNRFITFEDAQKFSKALDLYDSKQVAEALSLVQEILNKYPDFSLAQSLIDKINYDSNN